MATAPGGGRRGKEPRASTDLVQQQLQQRSGALGDTDLGYVAPKSSSKTDTQTKFRQDSQQPTSSPQHDSKTGSELASSSDETDTHRKTNSTGIGTNKNSKRGSLGLNNVFENKERNSTNDTNGENIVRRHSVDSMQSNTKKDMSSMKKLFKILNIKGDNGDGSAESISPTKAPDIVTSKGKARHSTAGESVGSSEVKSNTSAPSGDNERRDSIEEEDLNDVDPAELGKLPQTFVAKYLGKRDARGLWGIKHTRKPVDEMVTEAKALKPGMSLPYLQLTVSEKGVTISEMPQNVNKEFENGLIPVDVISYGVQDVIYTRVFAMVVVRDAHGSSNTIRQGDGHPFQCHAFVCDSRMNARRLTYALASTFRVYSQSIKQKGGGPIKKKFAIDLRSPDEIKAEMRDGALMEMDSEA